jgi:HAD superfamily hydrolase (TIGR01509 family)
MIIAVIFDLDGTLVKTEQLKALSYARAALQLRPGALGEAEVLEAFKEVVGLSRQEVATRLMQRFGLEEASRARMSDFGVTMPWQAFVRVRLQIYEAMLMDETLIREYQWPHNMKLLSQVRAARCKVALATMSHRPQAQRVLKALELSDAFDFVATREDVEHGKPDPEIYLCAARALAVSPSACLVVEDSPAGVQAGLAAGMYVVAVSTPLTQVRLHESGALSPQHIVDDPATLSAIVEHILADHQRIEHERVTGDRARLRQHLAP